MNLISPINKKMLRQKPAQNQQDCRVQQGPDCRTLQDSCPGARAFDWQQVIVVVIIFK
jgi:hypothetical protein